MNQNLFNIGFIFYLLAITVFMLFSHHQGRRVDQAAATFAGRTAVSLHLLNKEVNTINKYINEDVKNYEQPAPVDDTTIFKDNTFNGHAELQTFSFGEDDCSVYDCLENLCESDRDRNNFDRYEHSNAQFNGFPEEDDCIKDKSKTK